MAKVRRQAAEWARLIDQWRASGLSLPAFCSQQGLKRDTMQNWVYNADFRGRPTCLFHTQLSAVGRAFFPCLIDF
jgi:hypothetical protein